MIRASSPSGGELASRLQPSWVVMEGSSNRDGTRRWVLVADEDERAAGTLSGRLLRHGLWACPTARGDEALRIAEAQPFVLAVIDVALGDMPGSELAARLRALDPSLPVIMTTGDFRPELEVEARRVGIIHYAHKPLDDARLDAILAKILRPVAGARAS